MGFNLILYSIKKVFARSRFAKNLESISFYKNHYETDISDMKKIFEKFEKNNGLKIISDQ